MFFDCDERSVQFCFLDPGFSFPKVRKAMKNLTTLQSFLYLNLRRTNCRIILNSNQPFLRVQKSAILGLQSRRVIYHGGHFIILSLYILARKILFNKTYENKVSLSNIM